MTGHSLTKIIDKRRKLALEGSSTSQAKRQNPSSWKGSHSYTFALSEIPLMHLAGIPFPIGSAETSSFVTEQQK